MPGAGVLDKRIVIESRTGGKDSEGGITDTWGSAVTTWAGIKNLSGNERSATADGGKVAQARTEFTIRYRPFDETKRIVYGGKIYNPQHINDFNEEHRFLVITCDTGLNDGR